MLINNAEKKPAKNKLQNRKKTAKIKKQNKTKRGKTQITKTNTK